MSVAGPRLLRDVAVSLSLLTALGAPWVACLVKAAGSYWGFGLGSVVAGAWIIVPTYVVLAVLAFGRLSSADAPLLPRRALVAAWGFSLAIVGLATGVEDGGAEPATRDSVLDDLATSLGLRWAAVEPVWAPACFVITVACCTWLIIELAVDRTRRSRATADGARSRRSSTARRSER